MKSTSFDVPWAVCGRVGTSSRESVAGGALVCVGPRPWTLNLAWPPRAGCGELGEPPVPGAGMAPARGAHVAAAPFGRASVGVAAVRRAGMSGTVGRFSAAGRCARHAPPGSPPVRLDAVGARWRRPCSPPSPPPWVSASCACLYEAPALLPLRLRRHLRRCSGRRLPLPARPPRHVKKETALP